MDKIDKHERRFDKELEDLKGKLLHMAAIAEVMIDRAIRELVTRDASVAEPIPGYENQLNRMQIQIDEDVVTLLATQQPVASDLRFILTAARVNTDLERIGDLVINIMQNVRILIVQPPLKPLIDIPRMAELARKMVHDSLHALVRGDVLLAQSVIMADNEVDALKDQIIRDLTTYMASDAKAIERALALILISRHLERIADHSTNIAEDVIYLVQGHDVRHPRTPK